MKIEGLVGRTLRARPAGLSAAMGMAVRAGFLRPCSDGWIVLPLGVRVMDRMAEAVLEGIDCHPVSILAGRVGDVARLMLELLQGDTQSYRHLPLRIATAVSGDEGFLRPSTDSIMLERLVVAGAFADEVALSEFVACGVGNLRKLATMAGIESDAVGGTGGSKALVAFGPTGRSLVLGCAACGSRHLREAAPFARGLAAQGSGAALERVHTPGASTIEALAEMLGIGREQTLKALFLSTDAGELVFALVRGDLDASIEKLSSVVGARRLRPATDAEISAAGAVPGFASPIGVRVRGTRDEDGVLVIADSSVFSGSDFAVGANEAGYHYVHVDPRRDFCVSEAADIALAPAGARCAACGAELVERRGTILAWSSPMTGPSFADESGSERRAAAACMTVDMLSLFEELVSACADADGIAWPVELAPADVHVVSLKEDDACRDAVQALERIGLSVLFDDRPIGAGAKFADADLIGCPLRVTISSRSLQAGGAELAGRKGANPLVVPLAALPDEARPRLAPLMST